MAKRKNHTAHNVNTKAHRNGIKKPKQHRYMSLKGVHPHRRKNLRAVRAGNLRVAREKAEAAAN